MLPAKPAVTVLRLLPSNDCLEALMAEIEARKRVQVVFDPEDPLSVSRTQQHFKKEVDLNRMMEKYQKTGLLPVPVDRKPFYGDFTEVEDFHGLQIKLAAAQAEFMRLPSFIRSRFNNDPHQLLEFLSNASNDAEAVKLGLKEAPRAQPVEGEAPVAPPVVGGSPQ